MYLSEEEAKQYPILYRATFTFIHGNKATLDVVGENAQYYYYIEEVENFPWEPEGTKLILSKLPKDEITNIVKKVGE